MDSADILIDTLKPALLFWSEMTEDARDLAFTSLASKKVMSLDDGMTRIGMMVVDALHRGIITIGKLERDEASV